MENKNEHFDNNGLIVSENEGDIQEHNKLEGFEWLPQEVQEELSDLTDEIRQKVLGSIRKTEGKTGENYFDPAWEIIDEILKQERQMSGKWTDEEIEKMDPADRELATNLTLHAFLKSIDLEHSQDMSQEIFDVLDNLWHNRNCKPDEVKIYRDELFTEVKEKYEKIQSEKNELRQKIFELAKRVPKRAKPRKSKKGNDPYHRLKALEQEYNEKYIYDTSSSGLSEQILFWGKMESRIKEEKKLQAALRKELQYLSAEDFALIFADRCQSDFGVSEAKIKRLANRFGKGDIVNKAEDKARNIETATLDWAEQHKLEIPLAGEKNVKNSVMAEKLISHLRALIESYHRRYAEYKELELESAKNVMLANITTLRRFSG